MQSVTGRVIVVAATVAIAVAAFLLLQEDEAESPTTAGAPTAGVASGEKERPSPRDGETAKPGPVPDTPTIVVEGGAPKDGVVDLEYEKGDDIRFTVRSDVEEAIHVHGYDLEQDVGPKQEANFAFPAEIDGVFEVELENSAVPIAELRVTP